MPPETTASTPTPATGSDGSSPGRALPLHVNGEAHTVPAPCSIDALLSLLEIDRRRVAVAINRDVVPRSAFATHRLSAGDRVEILEAVGGG